MCFHSPEEVFDDAVRQRHGGRLLQALDVDSVVHPLHPSGDLKRVTILVRDNVHMTSLLRGRERFSQILTKGREVLTRGREGV